MTNKKILLFVFILVALVQLYTPAKMIIDREDILHRGKEYKFKTEPIDPSDPFRGKYITLRYKEDTIEIKNEAEWLRGESIYVSLTSDNEGYAKIRSVSKEKRTNNQDFLKTKVSYVTDNGSNKLTIDYPFDRYYMEESKAYDAELTYRESQLDTNQIAYALVQIKDGEAVLKDVLINGVPIREIVIKDKENQK
ncbi:GDYXXLXY domain-containing protein [Arenibacter sp. F26102]|uniref:GDYXXLXY domain-containing protein n=1 Tax=Arenibacter sp. F26102 TaxID=2926416 RepID=UPI001FF4BB0F|nr:GDYXXLXY domain-containing protein [Arenibacter sp. F26102]MCK0148172.1 GDYXXLXY domain-containing protein [Arenibacter sp. F26102]